MTPSEQPEDRVAAHLRAHGVTITEFPEGAVPHVRAIGRLARLIPTALHRDPESLRWVAGTLSYWAERMDEEAAAAEAELSRLVDEWTAEPQR